LNATYSPIITLFCWHEDDILPLVGGIVSEMLLLQ